MPREDDVIVVGAGIVGLATAYLAHQQGRSVHVIERAAGLVESSIQNFGHLCFTGQKDALMDLSWSSRKLWCEAARTTGLSFSESGTWIPIMSRAEEAVAAEFAEHRGEDQLTMLTAEDVSRRVGNPGYPVLSGAHMPLDARVHPRTAVKDLQAWLEKQGVNFSFSTHVTAVGDGVVETVRGSFYAREVFVCTGYQLPQLFPLISDDYGMDTCTLVMSTVAKPEHVPWDLAVFTGTSMARYGGFSGLDSVAALRDELSKREPELTSVAANLMITGGEEVLFVGDSHAYAQAPEPFIDEDTSALLLSRAAALLGIGKLVVKQRWLGRYAHSSTHDFLMTHPDARTTVVSVTSGSGMTLAFGLAERMLSDDPYLTPSEAGK